MKERILVVEDDNTILTGIVDLLTGEGYEVLSSKEGKEALILYTKHKPDLILLDIMIPEINGYDVCKEIRKNDRHTPIIMLTAKGQEVDKVVGLELGADDYIVKPFGINELLARVRAILRRVNISPENRSDNKIKFGDVEIDLKTLKGKKRYKEFKITIREIKLLKLFLENEGKVLDRFTILDKIWGVKYEGTTRTLDQHIAKLRQKIEDEPANPKHIITVHTVGYSFYTES